MLFLRINITSILFEYMLVCSLYLCKLCLYAWKDAWMWMLVREFTTTHLDAVSLHGCDHLSCLNVKIRHPNCCPSFMHTHQCICASTKASKHGHMLLVSKTKLCKKNRDAWSTSMCPNDVQLVLFWKTYQMRFWSIPLFHTTSRSAPPPAQFFQMQNLWHIIHTFETGILQKISLIIFCK